MYEYDFEPYEKVLYVSRWGFWECGFYNRWTYRDYHAVVGLEEDIPYDHLLPYNEETKHLLGTAHYDEDER